VRTLPQAPNLDYLKQQAKDLLAALRENNPLATLADAQRALAQLYGFRVWTELKAEVERARSKPQVFDAETASGIAKVFDLGDVTESPILVETNVGGPVVRLQTDSGIWNAHSVLSQFDEPSAEQAVRLMEAAGAGGIKTPKAIRSASGSLLEEIGENRWRVDEWMDLGPTFATPVSSAIAFKAGSVLATLHGLRLEPTFGMSSWLSAKPRNAEQWQRILTTVEEAGASWVEDLRDALPAILDVSAGHADAPTDGLLLSHTDFQPSGTHLDKDDALVPTGWEFAGAISREWHLGMVLDSWSSTPDDDINEPAAKAILEGYASVLGDVPRLDVSIFSPVITAWLNWLVSRMNWALGEAGDGQANAERELAHMLEHPKDRNRFERLLRAAGAQ
jgi:thiamine kinase-like enzyme